MALKAKRGNYPLVKRLPDSSVSDEMRRRKAGGSPRPGEFHMVGASGRVMWDGAALQYAEGSLVHISVDPEGNVRMGKEFQERFEAIEKLLHELREDVQELRKGQP